MMPADYPGFLIMMLPPGAFFTLGLLIAGRNWSEARANQRLLNQRQRAGKPDEPSTENTPPVSA